MNNGDKSTFFDYNKHIGFYFQKHNRKLISTQLKYALLESLKTIEKMRIPALPLPPVENEEFEKKVPVIYNLKE